MTVPLATSRCRDASGRTDDPQMSETVLRTSDVVCDCSRLSSRCIHTTGRVRPHFREINLLNRGGTRLELPTKVLRSSWQGGDAGNPLSPDFCVAVWLNHTHLIWKRSNDHGNHRSRPGRRPEGSAPAQPSPILAKCWANTISVAMTSRPRTVLVVNLPHGGNTRREVIFPGWVRA